jgi:hypothetical protein
LLEIVEDGNVLNIGCGKIGVFVVIELDHENHLVLSSASYDLLCFSFLSCGSVRSSQLILKCLLLDLSFFSASRLCCVCLLKMVGYYATVLPHLKLLHAQQPHPLDRLQLSNQPADVKPQKALLQVIETTVVAQNLSNYRSQWQLVGLLVRSETSSYENGKPNMDVSLCRMFGWHKMNHSAIKFSWRGLSRTTVILWRKSKGLTDNSPLRSCRPAAELAI